MTTNLLENKVLSISKFNLPEGIPEIIINNLKNEVFIERELEQLQKNIEIDLDAFKTYKLWGNINNKYQQIKAERDLEKMRHFKNNDLKDWKDYIVYNYNMDGGYHKEMNMKDIKYICKANQIKLSKVVNGARIVYKKKELLTKLKRKKII